MEDLESQDLIDKNDKPSFRRIAQQIKLEQQQNFISKIYCSVIFIFLVCGGALVAAIFNEDYKRILFAHQLLTVVGLGLYALVLLLLFVCQGSGEMRIIILLVISFSLGSLLSFVGSLQLMNLSLNLTYADGD